MPRIKTIAVTDSSSRDFRVIRGQISSEFGMLNGVAVGGASSKEFAGTRQEGRPLGAGSSELEYERATRERLMREISFRPRPEIKGHPTFWEAVRHNQQSPRAAAARGTTAEIAGRVVQGACWNDSGAALLLSGECALRFAPHNFEVNWFLISAETFQQLNQSWPSDPAPIRMRWHRRDGSVSVFETDTSEIVRSAVGKTIRRLVSNEIGVYLHFVNDCRWLGFYAHLLTDSDQPFLTWHAEDD
jgi:hypothetical protein